MYDTQSPPLAGKEWATADEMSADELMRNLDARPDPRVRARPRHASAEPLRAFGRKGNQVVAERPSLARRMLRGFTRFVFTVLIGVGATLGWQAYGDVAKEMLSEQAPMFAWLLSIAPSKLPVMTAGSEPVQQVGPSAAALDAVRRSVELLALKQDQMAQTIAALQTAEEDVRQKLSFTPPSAPAQAATLPPQAAATPPQRVAQPKAPAAQPAPVPRASQVGQGSPSR
jgi:hypothetical protein